MTIFFVGQRVRIVSAASHALGLIGCETRIVGDSGKVWILDIPCHLQPGPWEVSKHCAADFLEPIIPPGMQPVSWSECLWQPEGAEA